MTGLGVVPLVDEGLGNSAYLLDLGDGRALAVDASRDLRAVAGRRRTGAGCGSAFAADTHLHADFLSGAVAARRHRRRAGARLGGRRRGSSATAACATATRSTWAGCGCGPWPRPGTPTSTSRSCSSTATHRSGCSPAAR